MSRRENNSMKDLMLRKSMETKSKSKLSYHKTKRSSGVVVNQ